MIFHKNWQKLVKAICEVEKPHKNVKILKKE